MFLTNPDNYIIDEEYGIMLPRSQKRLRMIIRHNDSLSSFNYIKNKLLVMCIEIPADTILDEAQLRHLYIGQQTREVCSSEVPLIVDCIGFRKINEVTLHYLRRHVKIQQYSERDLDKKEYEFIKQYCTSLG